MEMNIYTTYALSDTQKREIGAELQKAAVEVFGLPAAGFDRVTLEQVKSFKGNDAITMEIILQADSLCQNAGKALAQFKKRAADIVPRFCADCTAKNILASPVRERQPDARQQRGTAQGTPVADEYDYEKKSRQFTPEEPLYTFDRVILAEETKAKIEESLAIVLCEQKVFREWRLYEIQPHPSSCLSFYGPSGTGKTMAAEAVACKLGKKILKVSYADVESKFHGEGPKMVKAIFLAVQNNDAVLFFDEADSLLSKRLTNVTQGSEQAINSMRSQILICLEQFQGIVIFATNLVVNYDKAFLTRLISVEFKIPGIEERKKIWAVHLKPQQDGKPHRLNIPLGADVNIDTLAEAYDFVGREIRNAVVKACVKAAMAGNATVGQSDFAAACDGIAKEKEALAKAKDYTGGKDSAIPDVIKKAIADKVKKAEAEAKQAEGAATQ